jgi:solute carrier family 6 (neurotransmitter transporter), invertebrate
MFGMGGFFLLLFQTGWQISNTIQNELLFPQTWPFYSDVLLQSSTWFYALVQVILSTQIGTGALPVITGKFLYKGDVIRMCSLYMCFNLLVTIIATAYYMTTFGHHNTSTQIEQPFPDLTTLTSIYDRAFVEPHSSNLRSFIPSLAYLMIIFASIVSISTAIYTSSRLLRRHPSYVMCLVAMFTSIVFLIYPRFFMSRLLDMRWTGMVIICALVFDIICITWVYGTKSLAIDLEFSIGRPIMKVWLFLWSTLPFILAAILAFFVIDPAVKFLGMTSIDPIKDVVPRWVPIVISLCIIIFFSIYETTKQVDYNICSMIYEATRPAKDWGPADPLVRHAWKQWKAVCDDTGQRDFTLRRRGTKDWTSSIKKGQYSNAQRNNSNAANMHNKYILSSKQNMDPPSTATGGSNSPNYSGSLFGDSAIEEDIGYDKYSPTQSEPFDCHLSPSNMRLNRQHSDISNRYYHQKQQLQNDMHEELNDYQKVPIRVTNGKRLRDSSQVEIIPCDITLPPAQFQAQSTFMTQNPLCNMNFSPTHTIEDNDVVSQQFEYFTHQNVNSRYQRQFNPSNFSDGIGSMSTKTTNTNGTHRGSSTASNNWRNLRRGDRGANNEFSTEL